MSAAAAALLTLSACGGSIGNNKDGSGKSGGTTITVGTTDKVIALDPAGAYDQGSWTPIQNIYQHLMTVAPGAKTATPDAAQSCAYTNLTTYTCTMKPGLTFSNGDPLDAKAVAFTFNRIDKINDPKGPSSLLTNIKKATAQGNKVVLTLGTPDQTIPLLLAGGEGALVDPKVFSDTKVLDSAKVIGSGPYKIDKYDVGSQLVLSKNPKYKGADKLANDKVIIVYKQKTSDLKLSLENADIDVAYRTLAPTDLTSLAKESSKGVKVVYGPGAEIRYVDFDVTTQPGKQKAVRQAAAYLVNRQQIASDVYDGSVEPLYSIVPTGLLGATEPFKDLYGTTPNLAKAKAVLKAAKISTPVNMTLWWNPDHYGELSGDEYAALEKQFEAGGLFKVTRRSVDWNTYDEDSKKHAYPVYELGWFPDYPDADDYLSPFFIKGGFSNTGYDNPALDKVINAQRGEMDQTKRVSELTQAQKTVAQDVPLIPIWQGKQNAGIRSNITGVKDTFDASFNFRFWLVGKKK
ncbi:MAG TPA: ABC transporter substrate-binding protein [Mycobacteriales bacterium]|nr:ABC transporter substrate-binding protein [Mycobacteriales bacterium]